MTLWAVVEDYYEGHPHEDNNEHENNLCCLYETKEEAENIYQTELLRKKTRRIGMGSVKSTSLCKKKKTGLFMKILCYTTPQK